MEGTKGKPPCKKKKGKFPVKREPPKSAGPLPTRGEGSCKGGEGPSLVGGKREKGAMDGRGPTTIEGTDCSRRKRRGFRGKTTKRSWKRPLPQKGKGLGGPDYVATSKTIVNPGACNVQGASAGGWD